MVDLLSADLSLYIENPHLCSCAVTTEREVAWVVGLGTATMIPVRDFVKIPQSEAIDVGIDWLILVVTRATPREALLGLVESNSMLRK